MRRSPQNVVSTKAPAGIADTLIADMRKLADAVAVIDKRFGFRQADSGDRPDTAHERPDTPHEYVVLASIALGWYLYYPFELDEFHRFVAAAKKIRAAARSFNASELQHA